jgi:hypothetical protein
MSSLVNCSIDFYAEAHANRLYLSHPLAGPKGVVSPEAAWSVSSGGFCISGSGEVVKRTYVYVDGFNLYYRALRKTKFKWLDLEVLVRGLLDTDNEIQQIRYFTAPVSGKSDPGVPVRQQRYLQALRTLPTMSIHEGNFLTRAKVRPLVRPVPGGPTHVEIWNTEEKGSDVNLATYLIHDAWRDLFDVAVVLSQDTDLNEPVRIVRDEIKKPVGVVVLDGKAPGKLSTFGSFVRHITPSDLAAAQFPDSIPFGKRGKLVERPMEWR